MKTKILILALMLFSLQACKKDDLRGGHTISECYVVDKTTQQPIANARVRLIYDDSNDISPGVSGEVKDTKYTDGNGFVCFDFKDTEDQYDFLIDVKFDKYFFWSYNNAVHGNNIVYTGKRNHNRIEIQPEAYLKVNFVKTGANLLGRFYDVCDGFYYYTTSLAYEEYYNPCPVFGNTNIGFNYGFYNNIDGWQIFSDTIFCKSFDTTTFILNF
jgi:hypothetical protein